MLEKIKKHHRNWYSIIIGTGIVLYWRGVWGLMDIYLFPNHELFSYVSSVILGLLLLLINDFRLKEIE